MKILGLMLAVAMVFATACGKAQPLPGSGPFEPLPGSSETIVPGASTSMSSALVALATACGAGQPITWTYSPVAALAPNYLASRDGAVSPSGVFTAPLCGSVLLGTKVNAVGSCLNAKTNQNYSTTVVFSIQQEQLGGSATGAAIVTDCGTTVECAAANPLAISVPVCFANQTPFSVKLYTRLDFTCGPVWSPTTPPTGLAACSAAISPGVDGPALCTAFTYSAFGTCSAAGVQTRTVLTSIPTGCVGGAVPVLTQACTPPPNGALLWSNNCQGCHGPIGGPYGFAGNRAGASAATIQAAINNNVGGMGSASLRALTPAEVAAIAAANP